MERHLVMINEKPKPVEQEVDGKMVVKNISYTKSFLCDKVEVGEVFVLITRAQGLGDTNKVTIVISLYDIDAFHIYSGAEIARVMKDQNMRREELPDGTPILVANEPKNPKEPRVKGAK